MMCTIVLLYIHVYPNTTLCCSYSTCIKLPVSQAPAKENLEPEKD